MGNKKGIPIIFIHFLKRRNLFHFTTTGILLKLTEKDRMFIKKSHIFIADIVLIVTTFFMFIPDYLCRIIKVLLQHNKQLSKEYTRIYEGSKNKLRNLIVYLLILSSIEVTCIKEF